MTSLAGQQEPPVIPSLDVDPGEIQAKAIEEEVAMQLGIWKRSQSIATAAMVQQCLEEKMLDENEKIYDEICNGVTGGKDEIDKSASTKPP